MLNLFKLIPLVVFLFGQNNALGFENLRESKDSVFKEIFVKGSIDGEKLFLVLGLKDGIKISKELLKDAIDIEALKKSGGKTVKALKTAGKAIYNKNHKYDLYDAIRTSGKFAIENAPNIFNSPWRSLKKIKKSFSISMRHAREAKARANSTITGLMSYSGHAVWANVKGAYYLVVEAPTKFVGQLALTTLAVPTFTAFHLASIPLGIALRVGDLTLNLGLQLTKGLIAGAASLGLITYSGISTTIAAATTGATYLASGAVKVVSYTIMLPTKFFKKAPIKIKTDINYKKMLKMADRFLTDIEPADLEKIGLDSAGEIVTKKKTAYKSQVVFKDRNGKKALTIDLSIDFNSDKSKQNLVIKGYFSRKHYSRMKKDLKISGQALKVYLSTGLEKIILDQTGKFNNDNNLIKTAQI